MKKKVIKPFDINKYQDDRYEVETKCGYHVKFLKTDTSCIWDADDHKRCTDYPVMARLDTPMGDRFAFYTTAGKFYSSTETNMDLVLVEEQETTSVTKEEFETRIEWFINHLDDTIEEVGKTIAEYFGERMLQEVIEKQVTDAQEEEVVCCALKLEGLEDMPNEEIAKAYVKDAVGSVNHVLGYSSKERNAFGWKKVWDNQGCFGVMKEPIAKKIIKQCPDFKFRLYYKSNITSDNHGEA